MVTQMALGRLGSEINEVHAQLVIDQVATHGFPNGPAWRDVDPKWISPHLIKCLPQRQGNGAVWQVPEKEEYVI